MSARKPIVSDSIELSDTTDTQETVGVVAANATTLQMQNNNELVQKQKLRMKLGEIYKAEDKVGVSGSPMYAGYFGKLMPIILNGVRVDIPLDGRRYDVPKSFADVFYTRLRSVDTDLAMQKQLSNVTSNKEAYAGELDLVRLAQ